MNTLSKATYIVEVQWQCLHALDSYTMLSTALKSYNDISADASRRLFFFRAVFRHIQSFLNHAANVSKLFKPGKPITSENTERAEYLTKEFKLPDSHRIHNRELRNDFEHYDERLDKWSRGGHDLIHKHVLHDPASPAAVISMDGIDLETVMRWYDPGKQVFYFTGKEHNLKELTDAVFEILKIANQLLAKEWILEDGTKLLPSHVQIFSK